jgi:hypothetical protein
MIKSDFGRNLKKDLAESLTIYKGVGYILPDIASPLIFQKYMDKRNQGGLK